MIKTFEQYNEMDPHGEIDPYGEEDWEDGQPKPLGHHKIMVNKYTILGLYHSIEQGDMLNWGKGLYQVDTVVYHPNELNKVEIVRSDEGRTIFKVRKGIFGKYYTELDNNKFKIEDD